MSIKGDRGTPYKVSATNATSAVATQTGAASQTIYITDISGSSDLSGSKILVKDGTTVIWQDIVNAGNYTMNFLTPLSVTVAANASVTVNGTALCNANMSGFIIDNN